jgi:hypothetical protein
VTVAMIVALAVGIPIGYGAGVGITYGVITRSKWMLDPVNGDIQRFFSCMFWPVALPGLLTFLAVTRIARPKIPTARVVNRGDS